MSDLLSILSNAQSSLAAQRALTATASHNIDNANTEGYSRQRAELVTVTPAEQVRGAFIGRGCTLGTISQARDRFLEAQIPRALADAASSSAQSEALQAYTGFDVGDKSGLGAAVTKFYSTLRALAQNPGDAALRTSFLGSAQALARAFNTTAQGIESTRSGLDADATGLVGEINSAAQAVAALNAQVKAARASGAEPNDLLDLRQRQLDQLATLAGATTVATSEGDVNVVLPGGVTLVAGARAGQLGTLPSASGHVDVRMEKLPDGSGPVALAASALGGTLGGTLAARDGALADALTAVDDLAADMAGALNAQHALGFTTTGAPGGPLFDVSGALGAARSMRLAISSASQLALAGSAAAGPGDATNANALLATESAALDPLDPARRGVQQRLAAIVSQYGASTATAKAFAEQDAAVKDHLATMRDSYSGVSIDDEMITLQQAQRGYEAIAKVIQAADSMLETLLNLR